MKKTIVCISDTHGLHRKMTEPVPEGDILLYSGDLTNNGELFQLKDFNDWIGDLPHQHKLVIVGNHDRSFEDFRRAEARSLLTKCTYLEDQEVIIDGIKFYGSPWQPWFYDWAFNKQRGPDIKKYWDAIPEDVDVLITHGPVMGILDEVERPPGEHVGCQDLKNRVAELKNLQLHVCGHIHCANGKKKVGNVTYINASICTEQYNPTQRSHVYKFNKKLNN